MNPTRVQYLLKQSNQPEHAQPEQESQRSAHVGDKLRQIVARHFLDFLKPNAVLLNWHHRPSPPPPLLLYGLMLLTECTLVV